MFIRACILVPLLGLICLAVESEEILPVSMIPLKYNIRLQPDLDSSIVKGSIMITFRTTSDRNESLTSVVMHSGPDVLIEEDSVILREMTGQIKPIGGIVYGDPYQIIKMELPDGDSLQYGQTYKILLHFTSLMYSEPTGLLTGSISSTSRYIASSFRPTFARNVFPCFDEPQFKVPVTLQVLRPETYRVVSTAPLESSSKSNEKGFVWDTFRTTPPISIHSLGLFMSEMSPVDSPMGLTLYAPPGYPTSVPFIQSIITNINSNVGQFPIAPLKLVVLPDQLKLHLASYGIVFVSADLYGYDEQKPSFAAHDWLFLQLQLSEAFLRQFLEFSKTPAWWSHWWLSESVGAYLAAYMQPEVLPWLHVDTRSYVLNLDNQTHPIIDPTNGSHWTIEKTITNQYIRKRGLAVLLMWSDTFAEDTVFKTVIDFSRLQKAIVTTDDFFEILLKNIESNTTYDVTPAIAGLPLWLNSSDNPVVTYLSQSEDSFHLSQHPENNIFDSTIWPISISLAQKNSQDWNHYRWGSWLLNSSSSFYPKKFEGGQWTLLNLESGVYRVNYNEQWETVVDALKSDLHASVTPDSIKATIQDDAVALSLQDMLSFSTAFDVLTYTQRYKFDWLPVAKAFEAFTDRIGNDEDIYEGYKMFAATLFPHSLLEDLDLNKRLSDTRLQYIRSIMTPWLCQFNIGNFRQSAVTLFDEILRGEKSNVDPGDLENVACYGARYNSSILSTLISAYSTSSDIQLKHLYTIGLGCLTDSPSVEQLLGLLLNSTPFTRSDARKIIVSLTNKIANAATIINYVSQQAISIQSMLGIDCLADVLQTLGKFRINLSKIESLANEHSLDPHVVHSAMRSVERTNKNSAWWSTNAVNLDAALPYRKKKTTTTTTTTSTTTTTTTTTTSTTTTTTTTTSPLPTSSSSTVPITTTSPSTPLQTTTSTTSSTTKGTTPATTKGTTTATTGTTTATTGTTTATTGTTTATTGTATATTDHTTAAPPTSSPGSTPIPSSCKESLKNIKFFVLVLPFVIMVFSNNVLLQLHNFKNCYYV